MEETDCASPCSTRGRLCPMVHTTRVKARTPTSCFCSCVMPNARCSRSSSVSLLFVALTAAAAPSADDLVLLVPAQSLLLEPA
eukprot:3564642-Prymnesium_polylepis.2